VAAYHGMIQVKTRKTIELCDITGQVQKALGQSGIQEGLALVYCPHTTAAVIVNENESGLVKDLEEMVKDVIPWSKRYAHNQIDGNAAAHLVGSVLGNSATLPVTEGSLDLGTWQSIFLLELDGARNRQVKIKVIGEQTSVGQM
jgi:secondary thiamine-phosphate synthase enzyme